jgi:small subunit ribosomal protein S1
VDKVKNVLTVGQEVKARVIKIDKVNRHLGLSIKAANYTSEQLKAEQAAFDTLTSGEDSSQLQGGFDGVLEQPDKD